MKIPFFIVDVFAGKRFTGNQLAVFPDASSLSAEQMQDIAREMHFSETTFIDPVPVARGKYAVRIFTPEHEVPFAGHPVLGTAFIIREELMERPENDIVLSLPIGDIPVAYHPGIGTPPILWMRQNEPVFLGKLDPGIVAETISLPADAIDTRYPVEEVSTGLPFILVPVRTLEAVKAARINTAAYEDLITDTSAKAVHLFCSETIEGGHTIHARMFGPYYGVTEDPATGSASGCLAGYIVKNQYLQPLPEEIVIEQGYEINRPSIIRCRASGSSGTIMVEVGGSVILMARGEMNIS